MIKTVVFDLDGTLLNTLDDLTDSLNYALTEMGHKTYEGAQVRRWIGGGAGPLVAAAMEGESEERVAKCKEIFLGHYIKNADNKTDLYPGIREMVTALYEKGYNMGVVSSKGDVAVKALINSYFGKEMPVALGEHPDIRKKPAPDAVFRAMEVLGGTKEDTIYVGDSEVDVATAKNAGIPCIIVTWGFRDREELESLNPDYIIDTPEQILEIL